MSAAIKSGILLAATLALGVVLGLTGAGALDRRRMERRGPPGRSPGLVGHMEEAIVPRDADQASRVRPILEKAAERNRELIQIANLALRASIDSMRAELAPLLDEQQRSRLNEVVNRMPPVGLPGGGRRGGGPPPGDGPPGFGRGEEPPPTDGPPRDRGGPGRAPP